MQPHILDPEYLHVGMLFPVVNGVVYAGQRATEPQKGLYGPIGGKHGVAPTTNHPWNEPLLIEKMGGARVVRIADRVAAREGNELMQAAAVREFCEEVYSNREFPHDFTGTEIQDVALLGAIDDVLARRPRIRIAHLHLHLAHVHDTDFVLAPRELSDFRPVHELQPEQLYPIARAALIELREMDNHGLLPYAYDGAFADVDFARQIPADMTIGTDYYCSLLFAAGQMADERKPLKKRFETAWKALRGAEDVTLQAVEELHEARQALLQRPHAYWDRMPSE